MVEHIKIKLHLKREGRILFRNRRNFQDMETLSEKIFLPYESIPYLRIGRAPVKLVENDDVANDVAMEAVNGFEILYLDSFRSVKSKFLNINSMSNQQLADLWNMPEYVEKRKLDFGCNKTIELLIQYSAPGLSPIKITKGFNRS